MLKKKNNFQRLLSKLRRLWKLKLLITKESESLSPRSNSSRHLWNSFVNARSSTKTFASAMKRKRKSALIFQKSRKKSKNLAKLSSNRKSKETRNRRTENLLKKNLIR